MSKDTFLEGKPFSYHVTGGDLVLVYHRGVLAMRVRGRAAVKLQTRLGSVDEETAQLILARVTGQFR